MRNIKEARLRFAVIVAFLSAVCLGAACVLLSPIGASPRARRQELEHLRAELRAKALEAEASQGIDQKVMVAKDQVAEFYKERLPSSYAFVSEELGKVAAATGVSLGAGRYHAEPSGVTGLQRLHIDIAITGDYVQAVKFINGVERERTFFLIDTIALAQQHGGVVQLQIGIDVLLKES